MIYREKLNVSECFNLIKSRVASSNITHKETDIKELKPTGKSIIVICGNNTKNPERAMAYATHCLNWAKGYKNLAEVNVYTIFYAKTQPLLSSLKPNPEFNYSELSKILFEQLLFKNHKILSTEEIIENFSSITFFGHSIGGFIMNELMENLEDTLKANNFSQKEIEKIYSSIVFINHSPFALVEKPIKNVSITPVYDSMGSIHLALAKILKEKNYISSTSSIKQAKLQEFEELPNLKFIEFFESKPNFSSIYFCNKTSIFSFPNLLYYDGIREDHNLAGIVNYKSINPYKTTAGEKTTEFLNDAFTYSLQTKRSNFSTKELFDIALQNQLTEDQPTS